MSVRNGAEFLSSALRSLGAQSSSDFECLIMNDGSTDDTGAILQEWQSKDPRVKVFRSEQSRGLTVSLIELLGNAKGNYIARHDADDMSHGTRLHLQKAFLDTHPEIALTGCAYELIDESGTRLDVITPPTDPGEIRQMLQHRNIFAHGSWMARRQSLLNAGGYRDFFRYAQDYDLLLRLSEHQAISSLSEPLYQLRLCSSSLSFSRRSAQKWYAGVARQCARLRRQGGSDTALLSGSHFPTPSAPADPDEGKRFLTVLKSLHAVKSGQIALARSLLSKVPWTYRFLHTLALRFLCITPVSIRQLLFHKPRTHAFFN